MRNWACGAFELEVWHDTRSIYDRKSERGGNYSKIDESMALWMRVRAESLLCILNIVNSLWDNKSINRVQRSHQIQEQLCIYHVGKFDSVYVFIEFFCRDLADDLPLSNAALFSSTPLFRCTDFPKRSQWMTCLEETPNNANVRQSSQCMWSVIGIVSVIGPILRDILDIKSHIIDQNLSTLHPRLVLDDKSVRKHWISNVLAWWISFICKSNPLKVVILASRLNSR